MIEDKQLIRRALLGDQDAQKQCTEKGIVLPCWRCGGESEIQELHTGGKPIYAVTCKKTYCGAYGCAHSTQQKAIEYWNTRPAPPIGKCGECKYFNHFFNAVGHCMIHSQEKDSFGDGYRVEMLKTDFCSYFEPKEE